MTSANVLRRLTALESVGNGAGRVVVMQRNANEGDDAAEARWREQHPGEAIPAAALRVVLLRFDNDLPPIGGTTP